MALNPRLPTDSESENSELSVHGYQSNGITCIIASTFSWRVIELIALQFQKSPNGNGRLLQVVPDTTAPQCTMS